MTDDKTTCSISLTKAIARHLCDLLSTSDDSIVGLCRKHPDLPNFWQIINAQRKKPWFAEMFAAARRVQAEFLIQNSLDLAKSATPENAHAVRIKFDVAKWYASKLIAQYGDKPQDITVQTTVQIALPQQRLDEIKGRLESTRQNLLQSKTAPALTNGENEKLGNNEH